jgi:hypothetical protein
MMVTVRRLCRNVKQWRNAAMALRWTEGLPSPEGLQALLPILGAALVAHATPAN